MALSDVRSSAPLARSDIAGSSRREGGWLAAALATVVMAWVVVLIQDPRHFFSGDTEQAYYGWWYTVGEALRHGHLALLDPSQLQYGNHAVDGQLGLYNPLIALIGLGSTVAPRLVVYATAVKFLVAVGGVVGCYGLVRSYRLAAPLAAAASVAVALCGFTFSLSEARWFDGQLGVALLPWAWWAIRRMIRGRSPFPALVFCYLIVTVGYVFPTLYLGAVVVVCLIEAALQFGRRAVLRVVLVGLFCALTAILVYLPGLKTASFTVRSGTGIVWNGPDRLHWWQLPLLYQPAGTTDPGLFNSQTWAPVEYVVWWLPLLFLVEWRTVRARWRELVPLAVGAVVWPLWSIGPGQVGPLRWPARSFEALTLMVTVFVIVSVARGITRPPSRRRIAVVAAFVVISELAVLMWHHEHPWPQLITGAAVLLGLVVAAVSVRDHRRLASVLLAGSLLFGVLTAAFAHSTAPSFAMPSAKAAYGQVISPSARGSILQIDGTNRPTYTPRRAQHLLRGSLWALTGASVVNGYTTVEPQALYQKFGNRFNGSFRPGALSQLLRRDPTTGRRYVDLFGISTIILERGGMRWRTPPAGWHLADRNPVALTWVRDHPSAPAGGVSWASPGTSVQTVAEGPLGVTLRVTGVPAGGGSVVLSRIAYPGYTVSGPASADLAAPLNGYLLRVSIPANATGRTVTVTYRPPGWHVELASAGLGAALAVVWSGLWLARRRRRSGSHRERNARGASLLSQ